MGILYALSENANVVSHLNWKSCHNIAKITIDNFQFEIFITFELWPSGLCDSHILYIHSLIFIYYQPQGKVMFPELSVCSHLLLPTGWGGESAY